MPYSETNTFITAPDPWSEHMLMLMYTTNVMEELGLLCYYKLLTLPVKWYSVKVDLY